MLRIHVPLQMRHFNELAMAFPALVGAVIEVILLVEQQINSICKPCRALVARIEGRLFGMDEFVLAEVVRRFEANVTFSTFVWFVQTVDAQVATQLGSAGKRERTFCALEGIISFAMSEFVSHQAGFTTERPLTLVTDKRLARGLSSCVHLRIDLVVRICNRVTSAEGVRTEEKLIEAAR